jgi:hypothetical protein
MMVSTLDKDGNIMDITNQTEIEKAIIQSNEQKYRQSLHTPFLCFSLTAEFGFKGLTTAVNRVLAGVYQSNYEIDD